MAEAILDSERLAGEGLNREVLMHDARKENLRYFGLSLPAILLITFSLLLPIGIMAYLSFLDAHDTFSFENYRRILESPVYAKVFATTFIVASSTTLLVVIIGYPLAYFLSQLPSKVATIALIGVLMPFWTPVLVRTYAWLALLQNQGVINNTLVHIGAITEPLPLANNLLGTLIGMVQIMLPFLVLPLYGAMRAVDSNLICAASNLGAKPSRVFWDVFFPLSLPGLLSGALMVFVISIGFYVTPAVLGGGRIVMVAMRMESSVRIYSSWGAASALGVMLILITTVLLFLVYIIKRKIGERNS